MYDEMQEWIFPPLTKKEQYAVSALCFAAMLLACLAKYLTS